MRTLVSLLVMLALTPIGRGQSSMTIDNTGQFIASATNTYVSALINGCNPQTEFAAVQFNPGLTSGVTGCVAGPLLNSGAVYQINAVSGFASSYNANAVGGYLQARLMANGVKGWGANTVVQDVAGLTSGVVLNSQEADVQAWNPPSAYLAGTGVLAVLYTPGAALGTYNFQGFNVASNRPGTYWAQAYRVTQGALAQGGSALYVQALATAAGGGTNYGGPNTLRAFLSYGNGLSADLDLRPDIASGLSPAWDGWHFYHNGGLGMLHHIYVDAPTMDYAFVEGDGTFYRLAAPVTGNGADQVFTLPAYGGTLALAADLANAVSISLVAESPQGWIPANTTGYFAPTGVVNLGTSANIREMSFPRSGTIANLYVCTGNAQPATGALVFTVQSGPWQGALTSSPLSVTVPASAAAGCYQDATHSLPYMAGEAIVIQAVNNGAAASAVFQTAYAEFVGAH